MRTAFAAALLMLLGTSAAFAQGPTAPSIPVGMDLKAVTVGAWSEYAVTAGPMPPLKQRFALVGRDAKSHTLELAHEGGMIAPGQKVMLRVVVDSKAAAEPSVKQLVMQIGPNDPMDMPLSAGAGQGQFRKLDPKNLVDKPEITVPAGTFKTRHYREKTEAAELEVWVSDDVPPFGIVKMQGQTKGGPGGSGTVTMELSGRGKGAKPAVLKPAKPFDQGAMMSQMGQLMQGGPRPQPPAKK